MLMIRAAVLVALAVLSISTSVAPGTASATTLCSVNMILCPVPARYPANTSVAAEALGEPAVIAFEVEGEPDEVECEVAESKAQTFVESGAPLMGAFGMHLFEGCVSEQGECMVTEIDSAYSAAFAAVGAGNGSLLVGELAEGPPGFEVQCGELTCLYAAENVELEVMGGNPAAWAVNEEPLVVQMGSDEECGEDATWDAEYTITVPAPLFVAAAP